MSVVIALEAPPLLLRLAASVSGCLQCVSRWQLRGVPNRPVLLALPP
jgi:hypothetical protein